MGQSLTDVLLSPIECPRCARCRTRMDLTSLVPRAVGSEERTFECSRCGSIETRVAADPLKSEELVRMSKNIRPPV